MHYLNDNEKHVMGNINALVLYLLKWLKSEWIKSFERNRKRQSTIICIFAIKC
jgi:hypothetical protein